jgi:hypothetical protein
VRHSVKVKNLGPNPSDTAMNVYRLTETTRVFKLPCILIVKGLNVRISRSSKVLDINGIAISSEKTYSNKHNAVIILELDMDVISGSNDFGFYI